MQKIVQTIPSLSGRITVRRGLGNGKDYALASQGAYKETASRNARTQIPHPTGHQVL